MGERRRTIRAGFPRRTLVGNQSFGERRGVFGGFGMQSHGDRVHYVVNGLGSWKTDSPWANNDYFGKPIDVSGLAGVVAT